MKARNFYANELLEELKVRLYAVLPGDMLERFIDTFRQAFANGDDDQVEKALALLDALDDALDATDGVLRGPLEPVWQAMESLGLAGQTPERELAPRSDE